MLFKRSECVSVESHCHLFHGTKTDCTICNQEKRRARWYSFIWRILYWAAEWAGKKSQVYIWDLPFPRRVVRRWNGKWNLEWDDWRVSKQGLQTCSCCIGLFQYHNLGARWLANNVIVYQSFPHSGQSFIISKVRIEHDKYDFLRSILDARSYSQKNPHNYF